MLVLLLHRVLLRRVLVSLALASALSCHRDPPRTEAAAVRVDTGDASTFDAAALAEDPAMAARLLRLPFAEASRRLGSLTFEARSFFVFSRGGEEREQTHIARLTQDPAGNFHVIADTGPSRIELYLVGEDVYVRQDKGHLRKKPRRDVATEAWRDLVWSSLQQSLGLFEPHVRYTDPRPEALAGRQALRYRLTLAAGGDPAPLTPPTPAALPAAPISRWRELGRPLALAGGLWIDAATGVPLQMKIEGRIEVADRDVRPTQLSIRYDALVSKVGAVALLSAPESIPELSRTPLPDDPIRFFRAELEAFGAPSGSGPGSSPDNPSKTDAPPRPQP